MLLVNSLLPQGPPLTNVYHCLEWNTTLGEKKKRILSVKSICFHVVMSYNFELQYLRQSVYKLYPITFCGFARMLTETRARFLAYPDTMLDILLLPLLMHSPPALCFRILHSVHCVSDLPYSGRISSWGKAYSQRCHATHHHKLAVSLF